MGCGISNLGCEKKEGGSKATFLIYVHQILVTAVNCALSTIYNNSCNQYAVFIRLISVF